MAEGEDSGGMDVPITEELESVDFLLPQIPPDEGVISTLADEMPPKRLYRLARNLGRDVASHTRSPLPWTQAMPVTFVLADQSHTKSYTSFS